MFFKPKRRVFVVENLSGINTVVGRKTLKSDGTISFRKQSWKIDTGCPTVLSQKYFSYYVDTQGRQIYFQGGPVPAVEPEVLNLIIEQKVVAQCVSTIGSALNFGLLGWIGLGLLSGVPLGFVICSLIGG